MDEGSQDKRIHGPGMYAIWNNGPAGSRRIRSRVFAVGLFRYIVCNLIISVVNNPVNKPRKTKLKYTLEVRRFDGMKKNVPCDAEMESSVISIVSVSRAVYLFSEKIINFCSRK